MKKQDESKTVKPLFKDLVPRFDKIYKNELYIVKASFFSNLSKSLSFIRKPSFFIYGGACLDFAGS